MNNKAMDLHRLTVESTRGVAAAIEDVIDNTSGEGTLRARRRILRLSCERLARHYAPDGGWLRRRLSQRFRTSADVAVMGLLRRDD